MAIKDFVVTVPAAPAGETRLVLRWTDPNFELAKARLTRARNGVVENEVTLNAGVRSYSDTGLMPTTTYKYMVFAFNASAEAAGVSRSATTLTPPPPPPPPIAPDQLACTMLTATSASLKWRDRSADETGFEIERATAGGAFARVKTLGANVMTWSDTTLSPATTYGYRVRGVRGTEHSDYSAEAGGTTPALPPPPPAAPASLTASAVGVERVNLQWTDRSSNETGFRLERAVGASGAFSEIAAPAANVTTYTDEAVAPATAYRYRMQAENSGGRSAYSNTASVTTDRLVRGSLQVTGNLTFGVVKSRKSKTLAVTFKNVSASEKLSLNVGSLSKPFAVVSGGGTGILEPGASRTVHVSFMPKKRKKFSATLTATTSDPQHSTVEIPATGKGK